MTPQKNTNAASRPHPPATDLPSNVFAPPRLCENSSPELGQATTEYMLTAGAMAFALFTPWPFFDDRSVFILFIDVFDIYLRSFHSVLTLPVP